MLLSRELKIPFVVTVHGLDAFSTRQVEGRAGEWCARVSRSVYRSACSVICISEKVRDQVIEGAGPRVNATVIYNGVDPEMFSAADGEPVEPVILCVGNLIPIKGHELLLRAFAAIQNQFSRLSLEIIGEGPERPRLQKLADELGMPLELIFEGGRAAARSPTPCGALLFLHYPAVTRDWDACIWRQCRRANRLSHVAARGLKKWLSRESTDV